MASEFLIGKFFYWVRYRIGEYCLRSFVWLFAWIPSRAMLLVTAVASRITFFVLWRYRKRMEANVATALGSEVRTPEERKRLVRRAWDNFACSVYETIAVLYSSPEAIRAGIVIEGEEHLSRALARGKGVIALSAHLGNFMVIGIRLAASGYPFKVVVKHPRDKAFGRLLDHYRTKVGLGSIAAKPRREAARQVLKALRANEVVLMIADEFKSGGVEIEFLGQLVPAPRGPVTLALRSGAAVLPMFVVRDGANRSTLHIWPEIEIVKSGEVQDDVAANAASFARRLDAMVRRYPEHWNWLGFNRNGPTQRAQVGVSAVETGGEARPPAA
jgi:Kdo2-lipid IVA lauroyltransferase/acyltransferase